MTRLTYDNVTTFSFEKGWPVLHTALATGVFLQNIVDADVLSVNYYDDYDFNNTGTPVNQYVNPNQTGFASTATAYTSGLPTGAMSRVINPSGNAGG